jgi:polysaccharide export outer membrane protein
MNKILLNFLITATLMAVFSSCRVYNSNRMFKTDHDILVDSIQNIINKTDQNYVIRKNDYISLKVFTNDGERSIDPDYELQKQQAQQVTEPPKYLVKENGFVKLPMVGEVQLQGLTIYQADTLLATQYSRFYHDAFVLTKLVNRRVIVLGPGTTIAGKVIPLENENMNLIEVIALYGGITEFGKAYNIRIIRGDLKNPQVEVIDLSTVEGMTRANLNVYPNDIIYIESSRKIFSETVRDIAPLLSVLTNLIVAVVVITR